MSLTVSTVLDGGSSTLAAAIDPSSSGPASPAEICARDALDTLTFALRDPAAAGSPLVREWRHLTGQVRDSDLSECDGAAWIRLNNLLFPESSVSDGTEIDQTELHALFTSHLGCMSPAPSEGETIPTESDRASPTSSAERGSPVELLLDEAEELPRVMNPYDPATIAPTDEERAAFNSRLGPQITATQRSKLANLFSAALKKDADFFSSRPQQVWFIGTNLSWSSNAAGIPTLKMFVEMLSNPTIKGDYQQGCSVGKKDAYTQLLRVKYPNVCRFLPKTAGEFQLFLNEMGIPADGELRTELTRMFVPCMEKTLPPGLDDATRAFIQETHTQAAQDAWIILFDHILTH